VATLPENLQKTVKLQFFYSTRAGGEKILPLTQRALVWIKDLRDKKELEVIAGHFVFQRGKGRLSKCLGVGVFKSLLVLNAAELLFLPRHDERFIYDEHSIQDN